MSQPKLFNHFLKQRKVVELLSTPSPPLSEKIIPLAEQKQANAIGTQIPTQSIQGNFPKATKATQKLEQEAGITYKHKVSNSATKRKQIPKALQTQNTSHQLQDIQYESSHSTVGEVHEITTEQISRRQRRPETGCQTYTKQRHYQLRLYYKCRQTGHLIKIVLESQRRTTIQ